MGRKSGISGRGYHPKIWKMHFVMDEIRRVKEQAEDEAYKDYAENMMRLNEIRCNELIALEALRCADDGWMRWYDDDNNIPPIGTREDRTELMKARVLELNGTFPNVTKIIYRDIFIFNDEVGYFFISKETDGDFHFIEFTSLESAKSFIDGLPFGNLGFGWALDVLPKYVGVMQ